MRIRRRTPLQSSGGGHFNHALFWEYMTPPGGGEPHGNLAQAMTKIFGGFGSGPVTVRQHHRLAGAKIHRRLMAFLE
jgi:superoxide dismutase